ncbi:MAG: hypothetical protein ACLT98_09090 [Eggerthellaceae bacterium]
MKNSTAPFLEALGCRVMWGFMCNGACFRANRRCWCSCRMVWSCVFIILLCSFVKRTRFLSDARSRALRTFIASGVSRRRTGRLHLGGQQRPLLKRASATICARCSTFSSA